jgi:hypothetical protein
MAIAGPTSAKSIKSAVVGTTKPRLFNVLGPGLITGASDDDPSGIATYSQAGAQFGFTPSATSVTDRLRWNSASASACRP